MDTMEVTRIRDPKLIRSLIRVRASHKEIEDELLNMFVEAGALLEGHFRLESGQHSSLLTHFADIADNSSFANKIADRQIDQLKRENIVIDSVLTQESAGRSIGTLIARKLGKRLIIMATNDKNQPIPKLVNEEALYPGDNVLVVVDVSTTGYSLETMVSLVRDRKATPKAIVVSVVRSKEALSNLEKEGIKIFAVFDSDLSEYTYGIRQELVGDKCEICRRQGSPQPIASWQI